MEKYVPPVVTVDSVIFQIIDGDLNVLLIKRENDPFKDKLALPGAYNARGETTREAIVRVSKSKAGIDMNQISHTEQLYTFDAVADDPRGHAVSVVYMSLGHDIAIAESESTESPAFYPVNDLPKLAYDHAEVIAMARRRLAGKVSYTNIVYSLLPKKFTLSDLRSAYEAIMGRELDKRNFRKKFLALGMIQETGDMSTGHAYRPAKLYAFKQRTLQTLVRSFD